MTLAFTYIILDSDDHPVRDPDNHEPIEYTSPDDAENAIVELKVGRRARVIPYTEWLDVNNN
jgi:hypothetical protein